MTTYEIGRLLRAGTTGFIAGCSVSQLKAPSFGALVCAPLTAEYKIFGLIYDIHIDDDGLVRQLVTAGEVDAATIADSRVNRIVPVEMSVQSVGYELDGQVSHLLPPRPPLSLDVIYLCSGADIVQFTQAGKFGYFRHILQAKELPVGELLAAHLQQAAAAHNGRATGDQNGRATGDQKDKTWLEKAIQELITLLRDDYPTLMSVLGALGEVV
ncbi:MAG: hypothetical protein ABIJ39_05350 [Chloroflexota bacterium]